MKVDYIGICDCNCFEEYDTRLVALKKSALQHVKKCGGEVFIDQCVENEVNDGFNTVKVRK